MLTRRVDTTRRTVVVEQESTCRVVHLILIAFSYTYDTGAVIGMESGVEFYTLALIEINIAASQPFITYV